MHIMEGFLPASHALGWYAASAPFVVAGAARIRTIVREKPEARLTLAASGAFAFVLSALKIPSVTGSCSHPTGTGLGAIVFGPSVMAVLGVIVLLFQALLLAHDDAGGQCLFDGDCRALGGLWGVEIGRTGRVVLRRFGVSGGCLGRSGHLCFHLVAIGAGLS